MVPGTTSIGFAVVDSIAHVIWPGVVATPSDTTASADQHDDLVVLFDFKEGTATAHCNVQGFIEPNHTWSTVPKQVIIPTATANGCRC